MVIYKTTNLVNGKIYIGQDSKNNPEYLGSGKIIKRAIKKYGKENFKKEILEECTNQTELDIKEKYWIQELNTINQDIGYNVSFGGQTGWYKGLKHTEETKRIYSLTRKGKLIGDKNGMYGKQHTENAKKKMSNPQFGDKNGMYGKQHTEETKKKMSESLSGENNSFFGKQHTEETKKKMSESAKKRKTNPNSKKVSVDGLVFNSASEAARFFGLSSGTISYRCREKILNCFWVE
jgi:group I intron endonuclease